MKALAMNRITLARGLNPRRDARLLAQRLPTVIDTEDENEEMLAAIWELMKKGEDKLSAEELPLLELMSVLVERFEEEHYPIPDSPPHRILQHLMESRNAKQADLVPILGGRGRVLELVNGKRAILADCAFSVTAIAVRHLQRRASSASLPWRVDYLARMSSDARHDSLSNGAAKRR